jgi:hypothetical protein
MHRYAECENSGQEQINGSHWLKNRFARALKCEPVHPLDSFGWGLRRAGNIGVTEWLFSHAGLEARIPADHPMRGTRILTNEALAGLSQDFNKVYSCDGRLSIPPKRLVRVLVLHAFIRCTRSGS